MSENTRPVHEVDDYGNDVHVDVDPYIPTGLCAICTWEPPYEWVEPEPELPAEEELPPTPEPVEDPEETPTPETTEP